MFLFYFYLPTVIFVKMVLWNFACKSLSSPHCHTICQFKPQSSRLCLSEQLQINGSLPSPSDGEKVVFILVVFILILVQCRLTAGVGGQFLLLLHSTCFGKLGVAFGLSRWVSELDLLVWWKTSVLTMSRGVVVDLAVVAYESSVSVTEEAWCIAYPRPLGSYAVHGRPGVLFE